MGSKYESLMDTWSRKYLSEISTHWGEEDKRTLKKALMNDKPIRVESTVIYDRYCETCRSESAGISFEQGYSQLYETSAMTVPEVINALLDMQEQMLTRSD